MANARRVLALAVTALLSSTPAIAAAHPAGSFDACLTRTDVNFCDDVFSYIFGDTVLLKATVAEVHDRAVVLRKLPGDRWRRVDAVTISSAGRMTWRWHSHRRDADQEEPTLLRFRIPGHGQSDVVQAFVLFGE